MLLTRAIKVPVFKLVQYTYHIQILQQINKQKTSKIKMTAYINHIKKNLKKYWIAPFKNWNETCIKMGKRAFFHNT